MSPRGLLSQYLKGVNERRHVMMRGRKSKGELLSYRVSKRDPVKLNSLFVRN
jgi:hypothetical protein